VSYQFEISLQFTLPVVTSNKIMFFFQLSAKKKTKTFIERRNCSVEEQTISKFNKLSDTQGNLVISTKLKM